MEAIKETGQIKREQRDLEEQVQASITLSGIVNPRVWRVCVFQIDSENSKKMKANLERIGADFDQMKKENAQLSKKLKALS